MTSGTTCVDQSLQFRAVLLRQFSPLNARFMNEPMTILDTEQQRVGKCKNIGSIAMEFTVVVPEPSYLLRVALHFLQCFVTLRAAQNKYLIREPATLISEAFRIFKALFYLRFNIQIQNFLGRITRNRVTLDFVNALDCS